MSFYIHLKIAGVDRTVQALHNYGIITKYELYNGLTLCAAYHREYDKLWSLGIDKDGYIWKRVNAEWTQGRCIFPDGRVCNRAYPSSDLKFKRFVKYRNKMATKVTRFTHWVAAIFTSHPNRKI